MAVRDCGECAVCCEVAAVPALDKPALTKCEFQERSEAGCCSIFGSDGRPAVCTAFRCSWLEGVGAEDMRPDLIGAMFSVGRTERGVIGLAVETEPDSITSTAKDMAVEFARTHPMPLVVSAYSKDTAGEWVIVDDGLRRKALQMLGAEVTRLSGDVGMYVRRDP